MKNYIKLGDVVEVESNPFFPALVGSQGVVKQVLAGKQCLIEFPTKKRNANLDNLEEKFEDTQWLLPFQYLLVLDSPYDDKIGLMEEEILGLEADLVTARALLHVSEDMREHQLNLIEKLVEDADKLKAELYHLKGN